jgi:hypothetical protein
MVVATEAQTHSNNVRTYRLDMTNPLNFFQLSLQMFLLSKREKQQSEI